MRYLTSFAAALVLMGVPGLASAQQTGHPGMDQIVAEKGLQRVSGAALQNLPPAWEQAIQAQDRGLLQFGTGLKLEEKDALRAAAQSSSARSTPAAGLVRGPNSIFGSGLVDLSPDFPIPGDQGMQGSCVGWATAYARTYLSRVRHGTSRHMMFSPSFYYNQIHHGHCDTGSAISDAMAIMATQGGVSMDRMPYTDAACATKPSPKALDRARHHRIGSYAVLDLFDMAGQTRAYLNAGIPVVIAMALPLNIIIYDGGVMDWIFPYFIGGHAMTVVGYDDRRQAFKIINSWGSDWGDNGFMWVSYEVYSFLTYYGYAPLDMANDALVDGTTQSPAGVRPARENIDGITVENRDGFALPDRFTDW